MDKKIIWVAGMPRAGSMWTYNVTRTLLRVAGMIVCPEKVPKSDAEMIACSRHAHEDINGDVVYVLKVHANLDPVMDRSFFITTVRDVRDALVSWMRFMRADFDMALQQGIEMTRFIDHYNRFPADRILRIQYGDILGDSRGVCRKVAARLSLDLNDADINAVDDMYSKTNVGKLVAVREREIQGQLQRGIRIRQDDLAVNFDRTVRAFDPDTGFQSGHISSYTEGDWRHMLTAEQLSRVNDVLGNWLAREGYEVWTP